LKSIPAVDMHCHLDLYPEPFRVANTVGAEKAYVLSVTTTPRAFLGTEELASRHFRIKTALGLHPQIAHEREGELALFDELLPRTKYVGEVGLDGGRGFGQHLTSQKRVFDHILRSCEKVGGRILSLHSRSAAGAVLDALEAHGGAGHFVLHWFSGTRSELRRAVALGCWFSVGAAMLQGSKGQALFAEMPPSRVLTETDGPFAEIEGVALRPAETEGALRVMAEGWNVSHAEAAAQVLESFRALVSI